MRYIKTVKITELAGFNPADGQKWLFAMQDYFGGMEFYFDSVRALDNGNWISSPNHAGILVPINAIAIILEEEVDYVAEIRDIMARIHNRYPSSINVTFSQYEGCWASVGNEAPTFMWYPFKERYAQVDKPVTAQELRDMLLKFERATKNR
jgi:hypothetical protein